MHKDNSKDDYSEDIHTMIHVHSADPRRVEDTHNKLAAHGDGKERSRREEGKCVVTRIEHTNPGPGVEYRTSRW